MFVISRNTAFTYRNRPVNTDADLVTRPPHAPFQHIAHAQFAADLPTVRSWLMPRPMRTFGRAVRPEHGRCPIRDDVALDVARN
jgi:hypothetical protein